MSEKEMFDKVMFQINQRWELRNSLDSAYHLSESTRKNYIQNYKKLKEKTAFASILIGLIGGFLLFPAPDFSKSLLVGVILPIEFFPIFVTQSLLFLSFVVATILPVLIWKLR